MKNNEVRSQKDVWDAVVVGGGPNGLAAAITLQRSGLSVLLLEKEAVVGGGMRSEKLTLPGFLHDVCSAVHPMLVASPFFRSLPLQELGLTLVEPPVQAAHPLDGLDAAVLMRSVEATAESLDPEDRSPYRNSLGEMAKRWTSVASDVLGPLSLPAHPLDLARFGISAFRSAESYASRFHGRKARAMFAGMAAHSFLPLTAPFSAAFGIVLAASGHTGGWPIPQGGSQSIARALDTYFRKLGGTVETNFEVSSMDGIPPFRTVLFDLTPKQVLRIAGNVLTPFYRSQLERFRYGPGVFKVDWALSEPVPFLAEGCRQAGTVHLGGSFEEIARSEWDVARGYHGDNPFVLFAQQSLFDPGRVPDGRQTAWAYCHVPHGSTVDRTEAIEMQVERFAPGFRDLILARHTKNTAQMEAQNPNYVGGDINGGSADVRQLFLRPGIRWPPYRTSAPGMYLCSSSTPPGGGVHGMCGYHAARRVLRDHFAYASSGHPL